MIKIAYLVTTITIVLFLLQETTFAHCTDETRELYVGECHGDVCDLVGTSYGIEYTVECHKFGEPDPITGLMTCIDYDYSCVSITYNIMRCRCEEEKEKSYNFTPLINEINFAFNSDKKGETIVNKKTLQKQRNSFSADFYIRKYFGLA